MFFATALSMALIVAFKTSDAAASFDFIASLHFLMAVLRADFAAELRIVFFFAVSTLFMADFIFGKPITSCDTILEVNADILPLTK